MPSCNGEDRGCTFGQHYPTRKRADFHLVARHEKAWQTASRGKADACPEPFVPGPKDQGLVEGTAGIVLAGAPSSGAVHAVAPSVYREVATGDLNCHSGSYQGAFEWFDCAMDYLATSGRNKV